MDRRKAGGAEGVDSPTVGRRCGLVGARKKSRPACEDRLFKAKYNQHAPYGASPSNCNPALNQRGGTLTPRRASKPLSSNGSGLSRLAVMVFSVPNGGLRSKAEAARMKWTGTVAGIPDLAIVVPSGRSGSSKLRRREAVCRRAARDIRDADRARDAADGRPID